ncbi:hypothetical protein FFK22_008860 [Mycobacterium sp. KBS0706]|uniref:hypothetical protein n=1 Tax=Mycobacterium sp. KBS0706 TaxID=2578109 RepID=UPI00110FDD77|nr:hypothetical protein [Mycobacterium sp. KBS0706]TSD89081.1 hypothetical protein FFK22_008860 [Mycobacterium sp. KBS0706]
MVKRHLDLFDLCVWAYQVQRVDIVTGRGLFEAERELDGDEPVPVSRHGRVEDIRRLGCTVDGGQHKGLNDRVHPDAVALADRVKDPIVAFHARLGDAPEWPSCLPRAWPEIAVRDRDVNWGWMDLKTYRNAAEWRERQAIEGNRVEYRQLVAERVSEEYFEQEWDERRRRMRDVPKARTVEVMYCPLNWAPSIEWIMWQQGAYRRWHEAMTSLQRALAGVALRDHVITGFNATTYW